MKVVTLEKKDCDKLDVGLKNIVKELDNQDEVVVVIRDRGDGLILHSLGRNGNNGIYILGLLERAKFVINSDKIGVNTEE